MKIGIVGWGLEAQSVYRFFGADNDYLIVNEGRQNDFPAESSRIKVQYLDSDKPVGIPGQVQDLSYLDGIGDCDKIVYQPTAYFNLQNKYGDDKGFWEKATTAYDLFFENSPTKKIIGITGTKGKGTTSTLIAEMLKAAGQPVHLGGNIGTPILDLLPQIKADDWVVWELANFQLKPATHSPHVAVCLMIEPDHMDWHPSMDDYVEAKDNIFRHQTKDDIAVYLDDDENAEMIAGYSPGKKISYWGPDGAHIREDGMIVIGQDDVEVMPKTGVKLLGEHNLQNVCAALTVFYEVAWNLEAAKKVLTTFAGLKHRLEFVRHFENVDYYDDSFGTNPSTAIVALRSFVQPVVIILGGADKGLDYKALVKEVTKRRVRHVIAIGQIGPKIAKLLREDGYTHISEGLNTMKDIVEKARVEAQAGDVVLLSAATSSFGMFKDYEDRGDQFKAAVKALV